MDIDTLSTMFTGNACLIAVYMLLGWTASLVKKDASIVDSLWGIGFVLVAWNSVRISGGLSAEALLIPACVTIWGARLAAYIFVRNRGAGEDPRYRKMRERIGRHFPIASLFTVFGLQGILMFVISLPAQTAQLAPGGSALSRVQGAGALLWLAGFLFESAADFQLSRFRADPANRGRVMDRGLWAYSRHPNYFGESLVWWGIFLMALPAPCGPFTIVSPALITFLLLRVSGVTLLEKSLKASKPGYAGYVRRTSAFVPWRRRT